MILRRRKVCQLRRLHLDITSHIHCTVISLYMCCMIYVHLTLCKWPLLLFAQMFALLFSKILSLLFCHIFPHHTFTTVISLYIWCSLRGYRMIQPSCAESTVKIQPTNMYCMVDVCLTLCKWHLLVYAQKFVYCFLRFCLLSCNILTKLWSPVKLTCFSYQSLSK